MISQSDDIAALFNILHDGVIVSSAETPNGLQLTVQISYLTSRIDPPPEAFQLTISGVSNLRFETWPNDKKAVAAILSEPSEIFKTPLDILSAESIEDEVRIACNQGLQEFDYCGGFLSIKCYSIGISDNLSRDYSISFLSELSEEYWDEFADSKRV